MKVRILGSRGIPATHGGFETFAEGLSLYLTARGHEVVVYCQVEDEALAGEGTWRGVQLVRLYGGDGPVGTIAFDWRSARHAARRDGLILTLGYNTAVFSMIYVLQGRTSLMNMDGIEWKRDKWSRSQRLWLRLNEYAGAKLSTHLIADHPEIGSHLSRIVSPDKISVIQYGATAVRSADETLLQTWRLRPHEYAICIARPEPENSLLEIVRSFSTRPRGYRLVVLGRFHADNPYHAQVRASASDEVLFPGAIYEHRQIQALRFFAKFYLHGHTVGGTNPSLVEALAAGNAVVARRNPFNQWVAGAGARYFSEEGELERIYEELSEHPEELGRMRIASVIRHAESFTDDAVNERYVRLFERFSEPASSLPEHAGQTSTG